MRSEFVFTAMSKVVNRYMLCTLASKTVRGTSAARRASPKAINEVLELIGNGSMIETEQVIKRKIPAVVKWR